MDIKQEFIKTYNTSLLDKLTIDQILEILEEYKQFQGIPTIIKTIY